MEEEGIEQQILLQPEFAVVGAVYSVNGYTGHVVLKTSDLENDSGYQTASDIDSAINEHNEDEFAHPYLQTLIGTKQDELTPGVNINISSDNVISATDTTYSAGNGININGENAISVDTTVVATQQNLANEVTNRENADNALQAQIDGISASSDVVDIVGTYAELQQYDTQSLKDNDIVKVLQDETQGGATTYYRWSTTTNTFTLIGQEGPYYTKAAADAQFVPQTRTVNGKALSSNITLNASDVSALGTSDIVQTTGSSTSQVMSQNAVTTQLNTKLDASDYVVDTQLADSTNPVQNRVINNLIGDMPSDFFSGNSTSNPTASTSVEATDALAIDSYELQGDTFQQAYSGKNLFDYNRASDVTNTSVTQYRVFKISDVTPNTTYIMSGCDTSGSMSGVFIYLWTTDQYSSPNKKQIYGNGIWDSQAQIDSGDSTELYLAIYPTDTATWNSAIIYLRNAQLEKGSTPSSYEPYVGGTASPNPDYPQDVQVVTGSQNVWVHGKNLLNLATFVKGRVDNGVVGYASDTSSITNTDDSITFTTTANYRGIVSDFISVSASTQYVVSWEDSGGTSRYTDYYDSSKTWISKATGNPVTTPANCAYIRVSYQLGTAGTTTIKKPQLEQGSTATSYEQYQGNNYTIDLGSAELCKIGTYQDYIYKSGDDWYVHKECGKIVLDGTETWTATKMTNNWLYYTIQSGFITTGLSQLPHIYSYYFIQNTANSQWTSALGASSVATNDSASPNTQLRITVGDATNELAAFKTWLGNTSPAFYHPLATPTDTKITDSTLIGQLEALKSASVYSGTTYFEVTANDLAAILDLTVVNANAKGIIYKIRGN